MNSLRLTAWGFLLVAFDIRIDGVDLLLDPVGWLMMLVSLMRLRVQHRAFGTAAVASGVGLVISFGGVLGEPGVALTSIETVVQTGLVFATCTGLLRTVPHYREAANLLRWIDLGLTVLVVGGIVLVDASFAVVIIPIVLAVGVAVLAVAAWFVILLFRCAAAPVTQSAPAVATKY